MGERVVREEPGHSTLLPHSKDPSRLTSQPHLTLICLSRCYFFFVTLENNGADKRK